MHNLGLPSFAIFHNVQLLFRHDDEARKASTALAIHRVLIRRAALLLAIGRCRWIVVKQSGMDNGFVGFVNNRKTNELKYHQGTGLKTHVKSFTFKLRSLSVKAFLS